MYIHDDGSSASQNQRPQNPTVLRPSQVYHHSGLARVDDRALLLGSFLSELAAPPTLAEKLDEARKAKKSKDVVFQILRGQTPPFTLDAVARAHLHAFFSTNKDELWLAETLAAHGPEPLWPLKAITDRFDHTSGLGSDPGNYKARLPDPGAGGVPSGVTGGCINELKPADVPEAFFFQGRSKRRALIIAGVHGDERRGIEVVKLLQTNLTGASLKPFFTTILVPVLIPRTTAKGKVDRNVPGGIGINEAGKKVCRSVEPNRNFPLPGEDFAKARKRGESGLGVPELMIRAAGGERPPQDTKSGLPVTSIRMLPETRILISLIERFEPERLASIHDHSLKQVCHPCLSSAPHKCGGEGPGIFVDPRGIDPISLTITDATQLKADDDLAKRMTDMALKRMPCGTAFSAFAGNLARYPPTVRYFSQQKVEGNSLGDWAPVKAGSRPAITTLTVEVPKYSASDAAVEKLVKELHRNVLRIIFLES